MKVGLVTLVRTEDGELLRTFDRASTPDELFAIWSERRKIPHAQFAVVDCSNAHRAPAGFVPFHGLWCPYCRADRRFIRDESLEVSRCEVCGVSDSDYWVRNENGMPTVANYVFPKRKRGEEA